MHMGNISDRSTSTLQARTITVRGPERKSLITAALGYCAYTPLDEQQQRVRRESDAMLCQPAVGRSGEITVDQWEQAENGGALAASSAGRCSSGYGSLQQTPSPQVRGQSAQLQKFKQFKNF